MSEVTAPIMTDATGQSIDGKLNSLLGKMDNLAAAFQPNASGIVYSNTTSGLTGDDVQEAIDEMAADVSEIKQSLSDLATDVFLGRTQSNLSSTAQNVSLSDNFNNYMLINIEFRESSNVYAAITLTSNYVNVTTSASTAQLYVPQNGATVQVYKNTNNSVYVKTTSSLGNTYNVAIRGLIKKANN